MDTGKIDRMVAMLRAHADYASGAKAIKKPDETQTSGFGTVLKTSLDQVNKVQNEASQLGQAFELGDRNVSLNDVMVSLQKASISFQSTVQVRNKLVQAYHEIMNMQI